jgi:hypothetical protein
VRFIGEAVADEAAGEDSDDKETGLKRPLRSSVSPRTVLLLTASVYALTCGRVRISGAH